MDLAILFHRLGPYHLARLAALPESVKFVAIEFSKVDNTYAWATMPTPGSINVATLFIDVDSDSQPNEAVARRLRRALDTYRPTVVAIPGWSSAAALLALEWCCNTNTPAILMSDSTEHDAQRAWWKEWVKSRIVRLYSSALVAGTPHTDYVAALGLEREKIFPGYDVVDNAYFATEGERALVAEHSLRRKFGLPENYLLASNRFIEEKNLHRMLEAYAAYVERVGERAWKLVLVGDGPLKGQIVEQVEQLGLTEKILLPGFKQYGELPVYYGLARAFILASVSETWGLVVNEAMSAGLPVLVSERCGCAHDLVKSGVNGFTFDPYNIDEMSWCMQQISDGGTNLAAMGQAGRDIIRDWSPCTFADNLVNAAEVALKGPKPRPRWFDRVMLSMLARR